MAQSSLLKGTLIITIATIISKFIGSIFQIPLQNIAGDKVLGIFGLVYPVYMIALILSVAGIPIAISKLISEARGSGRESEIDDIFRSASVLAIFFGIFSFTVMFTFSEQIALMLGGSFTKPAVEIVSFTLLIAPYMAVYRGFFQGFEDMKPTAMSQVIEQFVRVALILTIAFILVKRGETSDVIAGGVMVGSSVGALFSLIYLRILYQKFKARPKGMKSFSMNIFRQWAKRILALSIPIAVGSLSMALLNLVDSVTIPHGLTWLGNETEDVQQQLGLYRRGISLVGIASVFSSAVILPLIPAITKAMAKKDIELANSYIERSLKYAHLISWPAALGLLALTMPVNRALFMDFQGSDVVAIINFSSAFSSFAVLTTGILQGLNRSKLAAWIIVFGAVVKGGMNFLFVSQMGIVGAAYATVLIYVLITVANILFIVQTTNYKVWRKESLVFVVSSIVMGLVAFVPMYFFTVTDWSRIEALLYLVVIIPIGAIVYAFLVIVLKGVSREELQALPVIGRYFRKLERQI
ncbi:putative polysaccharide biosynthesis protein [Calidifontibacillus erzurumensis]|uniref:Polysaccharide biosynthesis protein n=1 Tax=Calidifontibacillus erzurumensis TaxID=2741433 RepID=A0A8J8GEN5_9BACI|nr:polysaccharide biosynthesis protein [Calidifontibacillus erzurumensis]NSL51761.1 polysaccharide biosynthesis protein [Calidifontibacillus erzurumensis]